MFVKAARNSNRVRRMVSLVCVLACVVTLLFSGCGKEDENLLDVNYITTKLEAVSELATAKLTMKNIIHVTEGKIPLINKKEFYMIYSASVKAGFDLSEAEIQVTEEEVQVTLPGVRILDVVVDEGSLEFFDKTDSIFNREDMEDTAEAIAAAKEDLLAQPEIESLKKSAEDQARVLLTGLLEGQIGERELIINIG